MKPQTFKIWDTTTALSGKNGNTNLPFLSFRPKDGTVQFSSCAVNVMGLKDDSNIVFIESETHDVFLSAYVRVGCLCVPMTSGTNGV